MRIAPGYDRLALHILFLEKRYQTGAEIGVQGGDHAVQILTVWPGTLLLIDPWQHYDPKAYDDTANVSQDEQERVFKLCLKQVAKFGPCAQVMRMTSLEAAGKVSDGSLGFVYIDANHAYKSIMQDLELWYPKVEAGGIISGHDFTVDEPPHEGNAFGVKPAVLDFFEGKVEEIYVSDEEWPTWVAKKS